MYVVGADSPDNEESLRDVAGAKGDEQPSALFIQAISSCNPQQKSHKNHMFCLALNVVYSTGSAAAAG